ncbi:hypothetical protein ACFYXF_03920 [Streptomyces sp. NPDC002680]|uniref:hypothetical protein n=1 Tax=Streptomyces sp. NPDC002680 TaxID=3364659 RepID=UPI0036A37286
MHITEFTDSLADRLPGWQHSNRAVPLADDPAGGRIWDSGPMPYTAYEPGAQRTVLTHHFGLQLYVMPRPYRPDQFLVLPMLPANTGHEHVQGIKTPRGIAVPSDPVRAAARLHRRLLTDYRLASATPIRLSSPGHLQIHVTFDARERPRIRSGYIRVFIELLGHGGFLLDPATGECHPPDSLSLAQTRRQLTKSLNQLRHRNFHVIVHGTNGPRSHPPLLPGNPRQGRRR